ncbi:hypothetical protein LJR231_001797 [Phyllobacterium sp. LjRoot231]|uniref:hypothetical protein n=1 Tax=Phyllobacterium sp. LjRoot231 TaxID=3342289 RepID=UPI003ECCE765
MKSETISATLAVIAAAVSIGGAGLQYYSKDRETDLETIKMSLSILRGEISDKTKQSRIFAMNLMREIAPNALDKVDDQAWIDSGTVPEINVMQRAPEISQGVLDDYLASPAALERIGNTVNNVTDAKFKAIEQLILKSAEGAGSSWLQHVPSENNMQPTPQQNTAPYLTKPTPGGEQPQLLQKPINP